MIDVKSLRIGNYIKKIHGQMFRVDEIRIGGDGLYILRMYIGQLGGYSWLDMLPGDAEPVTLTEEILFTFGFHISKEPLTDEDTLFYKEYCTGIPEYITAYCLRKPMDFTTPGLKFYSSPISGEINHVIRLGDYISAKIEYLHQLQNLYFDLTGKELKYHPTTTR